MSRWMIAIAVATAVFLLAVWLDASPLLRGPAPFPPEWRWPFDENRSFRIDAGALACGVGLAALLLITGRRWRQAIHGRVATAVLALATLLGVGLQVGLLARTHPAGAAASLVWRTEHPMFTGYYTVAASEWTWDPVWYLRNHARSIEALRQHVAHVQTHPPGAVLFYRGVIALCEAVPPLARVAAAPYESAQAASFVPHERDEARRAAALLAPLILLTLCAATGFAVASCARSLGLEPLAAARLGILWNAVPSAVLMIPEIDQLLTFLGASATAVFWASLLRRSSWMAAGAGVLAGASVFVSYGSAVYVAFGIVLAIACAGTKAMLRSVIPGHAALAVLGAFGFWAIPTLLGNDPAESARAALGTHFDDSVHLRSWAIWLLFNLWDLVPFLSVPLALLGVRRSVDAARRFAAAPAAAWSETAVRLPLVAAVLLLCLNLTGIVRGETGRSWMPLMPFLLLAALVSTDPDGRSRMAGPGTREGTALLVLLLVQTWALRTCWLVP